MFEWIHIYNVQYEKGANACPKWNELKLCELFECDADYFVKPLIENNYKFLKRERNGYDYQEQR